MAHLYFVHSKWKKDKVGFLCYLSTFCVNLGRKGRKRCVFHSEFRPE